MRFRRTAQGQDTQDPWVLHSQAVDMLRYVDPAPFVPRDERQRNRRCEEILSIQAMGLKASGAHGMP